MIVNNLDRYVAVGKEMIIYSQANLNSNNIGYKLRYKIDDENREIRLYDVQNILSMKEKGMIYYAILDRYYFNPFIAFSKKNKSRDIENYIVKENGYTYHEFNQIEGKSYGILGELLYEIPRQEIETEKLAKLRDVYDMLMRNIDELGKKPICIVFNGLMSDFNDLHKVIEYMFNTHVDISKKKNDCIILKKHRMFGRHKTIFIMPTKYRRMKSSN